MQDRHECIEEEGQKGKEGQEEEKEGRGRDEGMSMHLETHPSYLGNGGTTKLPGRKKSDPYPNAQPFPAHQVLPGLEIRTQICNLVPPDRELSGLRQREILSMYMRCSRRIGQEQRVRLQLNHMNNIRFYPYRLPCILLLHHPYI